MRVAERMRRGGAGRLRIGALLAASLLALALVAAGCGGDDNGDDGRSDEEKITETLQTVFTGTDETVRCEELITEDYVNAVWEDVEACVEAEADAPALASDSVQVSGVSVTDSEATAAVELTGEGLTDGTEGEVSLEEVDGDWRVSALSADFLRSLLDQELINDDEVSLEQAECLFPQLDDVSDEEITSIAEERVGGQPEQFEQLKADCEGGGPGGATGGTETDEDLSPIRRGFEAGFTNSLREQGYDEATIECLVGELRESLTDEEVAAAAGAATPPPAIQQALVGALSACGAAG